ncbi:hypothetical protein GGR51DRAFT_555541 [Nemania sp. FL0031]|nr:hypothetical protein GGR51DRAFT_555541 [Nemania sp. FL0031]
MEENIEEYPSGGSNHKTNYHFNSQPPDGINLSSNRVLNAVPIANENVNPCFYRPYNQEQPLLIQPPDEDKGAIHCPWTAANQLENGLLNTLLILEPFPDYLQNTNTLRMTQRLLRLDGTLNRFLLEVLRILVGGSLGTPAINAVFPGFGATWNFWRPEAACGMNYRIDYLPPVLTPECFTDPFQCRLVSIYNENAQKYRAVLEEETGLRPEHLANWRDFVNWGMRRTHLKKEGDLRKQQAMAEQQLLSTQLHVYDQQCIEEQQRMVQQQHHYQRGMKEHRLRELMNEWQPRQRD